MLVVDDSDNHPVHPSINVTKIDLEGQQGIQKATAAGVEAATGDFIVFVDHDDYLLASALEEICEYICNNPEKKYVYTDEQLVDPDFKNLYIIRDKDFYMGKLRILMFIGHVRCCATELTKKIEAERIDEDYGPSQDYDFALRAWDHIGDDGFGYLQSVLYKWRHHKGGHQFDIGRQCQADEHAKRAIAQHLERCAEKGNVINHHFGRYNVAYEVKQESLDKTSILLPTRDKPENLVYFLNSIEDQIGADNIYTVFHSCGSQGNEAVMTTKMILDSRLSEKNIIDFDETFNYSKMIKAGMKRVPESSKYVILANDDVILHNKAIQNLVGFADNHPTAGIVGIKLMFPKIKENADPHFDCWTKDRYQCQHGGIIFTAEGLPGHYWHEKPGNAVEVNYERQCKAVTFALTLIRRELFDAIELDDGFPSNYQDVIFCSDAIKQGWEIWYCPWAKGFHYEGLSRKPLGLCDITKDKEKFLKRISDG